MNARPPPAAIVLVVDDEPLGRRLARQPIESLGCIVIECANGEEALAAARLQPPDVALVDVQMPGLNGFEVCRQLTEDPYTCKTRVIVVTARTGIEDLEEGFKAGATDYIRKPFNPRELVARVRTALELKRTSDALLDWKDRMSRDLALAGALQRTMMSPRPFLHEYLRVYMDTKSSIEVGGDFFDVIPLADGRIAVYVGDVSGHGVGPAIAATLLRASLTDLLNDRGSGGPARIANGLHEIFLRQIDMPNLFATLFLAVVDPAARKWRSISCGHPAPIFCGQPLPADWEIRGGPPIGMSLLPEPPYRAEEELELDIADQAHALFVTDGLLEAANAAGEFAGRETVTRLLNEWRDRQVAGNGARHVIDGLRSAGYAVEQDDCSALILDFTPAPEVLLRERVAASVDELAPLARKVEESLLGAGWPEAAAWGTQLIALEHGSNAVRHGRADRGGTLSLQLRLRGDRVELLMRDAGRPWDVTLPEREEPDPQAESGRGLLMIRRIASEISYCRSGNENVTLFTVMRSWEPEP